MANAPEPSELPASADGDNEALENKSERDHVRLRTGTYLGGTGTSALAHTIHELIDNVADEWLKGRAHNGWITIDDDSRVTMRDDGRGIPLDPVLIASTKKMIPGPQAAFTEMRTGSKFSARATSGGMNGMGLKALCFMSRQVDVEIHHDGKVYTQTFRNGRKGTPGDVLTIEPPVIKPYDKADHGTTVRFLYDDSVFDADARVDGERIQRKAINVARLCPGLTFHYEDKRIGEKLTIVSAAGLADFITELNEDESPLFRDIIHLTITRMMTDANGVEAEVGLEVAFQPAATESGEERGNCFTNNVHNPDGGTHLSGFRKGLTRALNNYFKKAALGKPGDAGFENSDVMAGLAYVLSLRMPVPGYESQTKKALTSAWIEGAVNELLNEKMAEWLADHPNQAKLWYNYLTEVRKAREAMAAERKAVKAKIGGGGLDPLISKLKRESIRNPEKAEIYWVEGDSAGGSAIEGRDRTFQAILPFRGKMLNVAASDRLKALENEDVRRIATALETGMGQHFDIERLRYKRIILMADADADGGHIVMLWCTALQQMYPAILKRGHVYVAVPPLYSVYDHKAKSRQYFYDMPELKVWAKGRAKESYTVTRFKGLGEMEPDDLRETAMNPSTRRIRRIIVADDGELKALINDIMGKGNADKRRAFMDEHARGKSTATDVALPAV